MKLTDISYLLVQRKDRFEKYLMGKKGKVVMVMLMMVFLVLYSTALII
jgi:hypothetical protein